jgi:hypothetical protein
MERDPVNAVPGGFTTYKAVHVQVEVQVQVQVQVA